MKFINVLVTGNQLAKQLQGYLKKHKINCLSFLKCKGLPAKENMMEYIGFGEIRKTTLFFNVTPFQTEAIQKFILKYYNIKNNGIMFSIKGDVNMEENVLYVAIVNSGKGEEIADLIRKKAYVGATILEGRGTGVETSKLFGVQIDSGKELVFSVMPKDFLASTKARIQKEFKDQNTDVVSFVLPVSDFSKLHVVK